MYSDFQVKEINIESRECISILGTGECGARVGPCLFAQLNEPGGIAYSSQLKLAYVADTNNHAIKMIDFDNNRVSELCVNWSSMIHGKVSSNYKSNMQTLKALELSLDGNLTINFKLRPIDGYYLTEGSPSQVELLTPCMFNLHFFTLSIFIHLFDCLLQIASRFCALQIPSNPLKVSSIL